MLKTFDDWWFKMLHEQSQYCIFQFIKGPHCRLASRWCPRSKSFDLGTYEEYAFTGQDGETDTREHFVKCCPPITLVPVLSLNNKLYQVETGETKTSSKNFLSETSFKFLQSWMQRLLNNASRVLPRDVEQLILQFL